MENILASRNAHMTLEELHLRYDAVPPHLREIAKSGGPLYLARDRAKARVALHRSLARDSIMAIREAKERGSAGFAAIFSRDLAFHRDQHSQAVAWLRGIEIDIGLAEIEDLAESMNFAKNGQCNA